MTVTKYYPFKPFQTDSFFDELAGRSLGEFFGTQWVTTQPSVNIIEEEGRYVIEVAAPGLSKEDFTVAIEDHRLTISAHLNKENNQTTGKFTKKEFSYSSFSRSFRLAKDVDQEAIDAKYDRGVLHVMIPKVAKEAPKTIIIE
ncbi:MAG: Hsp20/alpha crystallin family protein [Bacteroidota bacterium]